MTRCSPSRVWSRETTKTAGNTQAPFSLGFYGPGNQRQLCPGLGLPATTTTTATDGASPAGPWQGRVAGATGGAGCCLGFVRVGGDWLLLLKLGHCFLGDSVCMGEEDDLIS